MNDTQTHSCRSLAEAISPLPPPPPPPPPPVSDREWPPHPPWSEPEPDEEGVVGSLLSLFGGIPVLIFTALLEAPYHYRLKLK